MRLNRIATHDCRDKACGVCEKLNVWNPEKASMQVLDADYFLGWLMETTLEITPKKRIEFVPLQTNGEDKLISFEERIVAMAERRSELKSQLHEGTHPKCSWCGSRHCSWDSMKNYDWGNYPARPVKARK